MSSERETGELVPVNQTGDKNQVKLERECQHKQNPCKDCYRGMQLKQFLAISPEPSSKDQCF